MGFSTCWIQIFNQNCSLTTPGIQALSKTEIGDELCEPALGKPHLVLISACIPDTQHRFSLFIPPLVLTTIFFRTNDSFRRVKEFGKYSYNYDIQCIFVWLCRVGLARGGFLLCVAIQILDNSYGWPALTWLVNTSASVEVNFFSSLQGS